MLGPLGARSGLLPSGAGEWIFRGAIPLAIAAMVMALLAMRGSGWRRTAAIINSVAIAAALQPIRVWVAARSAPPIHDVTTDLDNPPRYVAVARLRVPPANAVEYGGEAVASQQRASYGDLRPLIVQAPPPRVLALAADTARAEGWTVLAQDIGFGDLGRLEATDTAFLFGRIDDIVVRIVPHPAGSRVDVRSSARDDASDSGRNANRIRRFLAFLAERAAAEGAGLPSR
ncbi:MAG: DUF1499 domain-containing protein [Vicinamibacteraceae bacterium]